MCVSQLEPKKAQLRAWQEDEHTGVGAAKGVGGQCGGSRAGQRGCRSRHENSMSCCRRQRCCWLMPAWLGRRVEDFLHTGRGHSSTLGEPAAASDMQRRRRRAGAPCTMPSRQRNRAAPLQRRMVVPGGAPCGAGPWPVCVPLSPGSQQLSSGKAKCRLSLREAWLPRPACPAGAQRAMRATGQQQVHPHLRGTHRWQVRAASQHRRLAGLHGGRMYQCHRCCFHVFKIAMLLPLRQSGARRAGRARRHCQAGHNPSLPPLCSCRSCAGVQPPTHAQHPPGVQMCGCCWYRGPRYITE